MSISTKQYNIQYLSNENIINFLPHLVQNVLSNTFTMLFQNDS